MAREKKKRKKEKHDEFKAFLRESKYLLYRFTRNRLAVIGLGILTGIVFLAVFAKFIAPYDPLKQTITARLNPPDRNHIFGTDELGRDIFSRILFGASISLTVGVISVSLSLCIGVCVGLLAGYFGGVVDGVIMRLMDIMLAFPTILLAIAITAALGASLRNAMIAVGIVFIPHHARIVRSSVLTIRESKYVEAAKACGTGDYLILFRHVLPNCVAPIIVYATLGIATAILECAALGFLGLGAQPPTPEWGAMLANTWKYLLTAPHAAIFPGIFIFLTVLSFNFVGDGLRDALDPRLRR